MNEFKIITIEDDVSFVTIDTLVQFSGNTEEPIKALIRKYKDRIESKSSHFSKMPLITDKNNNGKLDWSKITLNERQAMFLLTLMANSEQVVDFKDKLEEEFYKFKNQEPIRLSPMEQMQASLVFATEQVEKEKIQTKKEQSAKKRALNMLDNAKLIEYTNDDESDDVPVEEFCKMLSDKYSVMIGRTIMYQILREMGLVLALPSTTPTQRGLLIYLSFRKHTHGSSYSTRVFINKADKLSKYMLKFLVNNQEINDALGNPFDI